MNVDNIEKILTAFYIKAESRKDENPDDANLRRFKDKCLFIFTLFLITSAFVLCFIFSCLGFKYNSPFTGIALNSVMGLALGVAGYYVRGKNF